MKTHLWLSILGLILVIKRSFVSTSPLHPPSDEQRVHGVDSLSSSALKDQNVRDLERLKPLGNLAVVKTHSTIYTNINGKQKQLAQTKEEVDKDGLVLARVEQQVDKTGENGEPHIKTSLDIPSKNIHKVIESAPSKEENEVDRKGGSGLQYSPADMAEYVFWTGDERGVTSAIEEYLQEGMMSREDAIDFLQEIKKNLEILQAQFLDQTVNKPSSKFPGKYDEASFFSKKSFNDQLANSLSSMGVTDDDYEDLMERLKLSDFLYNEYSLEEVIYQLAKVMFTQSLSRGSIEAQDALQKVTGFLDNEAQQGKISRVLEKKVLAVLISALSDTLTEHPELVSTARESLGIPQPEPLFQQLFSQDKAKSGMKGPETKDSPLNHRFRSSNGSHMKRTIQNSGLQDDTNKSS